MINTIRFTPFLLTITAAAVLLVTLAVGPGTSVAAGSFSYPIPAPVMDCPVSFVVTTGGQEPTPEQLAQLACLNEYKTAYSAWAVGRDAAYQDWLNSQPPSPFVIGPSTPSTPAINTNPTNTNVPLGQAQACPGTLPQSQVVTSDRFVVGPSNVWGRGPFTTNSNLSLLAYMLGAPLWQKVELVITDAGCSSSYPGTKLNGVESSTWKLTDGPYRGMDVVCKNGCAAVELSPETPISTASDNSRIYAALLQIQEMIKNLTAMIRGVDPNTGLEKITVYVIRNHLDKNVQVEVVYQNSAKKPEKFTLEEFDNKTKILNKIAGKLGRTVATFESNVIYKDVHHNEPVSAYGYINLDGSMGLTVVLRDGREIEPLTPEMEAGVLAEEDLLHTARTGEDVSSEIADKVAAALRSTGMWNEQMTGSLIEPVLDIDIELYPDLCSNLDGLQWEMPTGYTVSGGECVKDSVDAP